MDIDDAEKHAYVPMVKLAASIIVMSVALKNIGIDFTPVMQAWTARIATSVAVQDNTELMDKLNQIETRLKVVEKLAHEANK